MLITLGQWFNEILDFVLSSLASDHEENYIKITIVIIVEYFQGFCIIYINPKYTSYANVIDLH